MIQVLQSEFFRIRKSRLYYFCLLLAVFFVFALALTFHYNMVTFPVKKGLQPTVSLVPFTEFLFSDYSLIFPLTLFLCLYFTEDFHKGTYSLLLSKGISRTTLFWGRLTAAWAGTLCYLMVCFGMAYLFILSMWAGRPHIEYSIPAMGVYLLLQCLCFCGYAGFLCLLGCLLRHRTLVTVAAFFLLGALYLYLTKISSALDLSYSLYRYWIAGLSHSMKIDSCAEQLMPAAVTITAYLLCPAGISLLLFRKLDLRRLERR